MKHKEELLKQFEITEWQIKMYQFSKPVRNFNKCFKEYLSNVYEVNGEKVPLSNVFQAYRIKLVAKSEVAAIEIYQAILGESICSDKSKESVYLEGLERIKEMKVGFYTRKTEKFLLDYFSSVKVDAKSNGMEGLETEFKDGLERRNLSTIKNM